MLTVVVPVHNVAGYLDKCLESLARQTFRALDVVLVDDGSTDGSGDLATAWAARDRRFRLIRQPNRGLGAARNAGAALATGAYLAFVDADDVLPAYAFEVLVGALERTGSDFASGNVRLLTDGRLERSPLHAGTHRQTRLAVSPREHRYLVYDRLACNKVWRRSFWGATRFPEGVHYEDIPVTVPLYGRARAVDVLDLPVYYWRQRPPGDPSISQRLAEPRNLTDRFAAVGAARRELSVLDGPFATWYAETALQSDLRLVLEVLPEADDGYRSRFAKLAAGFLADVEPAVLTRLPARLAAAWRLAGQGDVDALAGLVRAVRDAAPDGAAGMAAWRDPAPPVARAVGVRWVGSRLGIEVAGARGPVALLWLRESAEPRRAVAAPALGRHGRVSALLGPGWRTGEWTVNVAPARGAPRALVRITDPDLSLPARWVDDDVWVAPVARAGVLRVRVERPSVRATVAAADGGHVRLDGAGRLDPGTVCDLERVAGVRFASYPVVVDGPEWTVRVPLADLAAGLAGPILPDEPRATWRVALRPRGLPAMPVLTGPRFVRAQLGPVVADRDEGGVLTLG